MRIYSGPIGSGSFRRFCNRRAQGKKEKGNGVSQRVSHLRFVSNEYVGYSEQPPFQQEKIVNPRKPGKRRICVHANGVNVSGQQEGLVLIDLSNYVLEPLREGEEYSLESSVEWIWRTISRVHDSSPRGPKDGK
jgi:hypothetical protein